MKNLYVSAAIAPLLIALPAAAQTRDAAAPETAKASTETIKGAGAKTAGLAVFSTGVAKGRDPLDSATSTSALRSSDIETFGARSLAEVMRNIPGIRSEYAGGEGNANYSIRGLPLSGTGSKYVQLQEDGLPVMEFADMVQNVSDTFMRFDLNVSQIETIRGGSASTFASNSPGGVINLLSRTGDTEGGAIEATEGLTFGEHRVDFDYGHKLSDTLRFHIGGFYREGEGPRNVGYNAYKGGQIKFNVTKQFENGFVRLYGKWLDDRTPSYQDIALRVSGTNDKPHFSGVETMDPRSDSMLSPNLARIVSLDGANKIQFDDLKEGVHPVVKSLGLESQFDVSGWSISEKFRFAAMSANNQTLRPLAVAPAAALAYTYGGGPGATLSYATGPKAGQVIASPSTLNGNGLMTTSIYLDIHGHNLNNVTNDLRASRVWKIGGDLTTTMGIYSSSQTFDIDTDFLNILTDLRGDGGTSLLNVKTATGVPTTQDGYVAYGLFGSAYRRGYTLNYKINAPYASANYHVGKLAVGASLRYDMGKVTGTLYGGDLGGGRVGVAPIDINGNGQISLPESQTAVLPLGNPGRVDYDYHYLSYSTGANYRISDPLAVFARYSSGGRASSDKILFTPAVNYTTGKPVDPANAYGEVKQAELGLKYRKDGVSLNVTGFFAKTSESNAQVNTAADGSLRVENIVRGYEAKGVEIEAGARWRQFSVTGGATYTNSMIASDASHPEFVGNKPRHQPDLIFELTPQFETEHVTVGANLIGTTSSFAQDTDQLKLPGYTLVNLFLQVRPVDRVQVMLNVNNLFDTLAIADSEQSSIPASGLVLGRAYGGRTVSATLRYAF